MRGVDTELVKRAQHGDREAFGLLAADLATRFLPVSRRILRDIDLAEDASQQALVATGGTCRNSATRRALTPGRTGSSCVPATPRAVGPSVDRRTSGSCRLTSRSASDGLDAVVDRDQLETAIRRLSVDHRDGARPAPLRRHPARAGRPDPGDPGRHGRLPTSSRDARHAGGTRCRRTPRASGGIVMTTEHDPGRASSCRGFARTRTRTRSACSCAPSTRWTRPHSAAPGGRRGGPTE